ncbi:MAG: hypothetical protein ABI880_12045 [Acidobacteriota bacterium]
MEPSSLTPAARRANLALAAVVTAAFVATLLVVGTVAAGVTAVVVHLLFAAPGVMMIARLHPAGARWLPAWTVGPMVGLGASSLTLLAFWALGGRGLWLLIAAPATALLLAWPAARLRDRWRWPAPAPAAARTLLLALLLVPVLVTRPFALVGAERPEGHVYRQYFTADYVWRRAVVAEVAKGDFPPLNPYYTGDVLHYYWLPHLMSAVEHRAWPDIDLDSLLLTRTVLVDAMFVAALYGIARFAVAAPWAALAGVLCGFLVTSFEALAALWALHRDHAPFDFIRYLNIDAISRWDYDGMPIDGLQRILWYQPHHAIGYLLGFLGVLALARRRRVLDPTVFAVAGTLLATSLLVSSLAGLIYIAVAAFYEAVLTVRRRAWRAGVFNASYAALPLMIGAAVVMALDYVDRPIDYDLSVIRIGLNLLATRNFFVVTAMSFGPALILGATGIWVAWRRRVSDTWPFLAVLPVVAWFYFYVDIRDHENVYVGWRVGHLTFMALIPLMGLAFVGARQAAGRARWWFGGGLAVVVVLAVPTVAIDAFNTQDVVPNGMGRAWLRTEVISPAEWEGLQWLRLHTAPAAVVQVDTIAREGVMWAYIPAFAERRMGVGVPISMVPLRKYQEGSKRVVWMYDVADARSAYALADRVGLDYLVVGDPERRAHPGVEARWALQPELLKLAFHNQAMSIYEVQHAAGKASRPAAGAAPAR